MASIVRCTVLLGGPSDGSRICVSGHAGNSQRAQLAFQGPRGGKDSERRDAGPARLSFRPLANHPEADYYLAEGKAGYRASRIARRWEGILQTAETIRTGVPQAKQDYVDSSPAYLERFYRGGHAVILSAARDLAQRFDFSGHRRLVDVGGGSGGMAIAFAEMYPELHATVLDLLSVTPIAERQETSPSANG